MEHQRQAIQMDPKRRADHRRHRPLLHPNLQLSSLAANSQGGLRWQAGEPAQAIQAWTSALEFGDQETQAKAAFNIGIAHHDAHDYQTAISNFEYSLTLAAPKLKAKTAMMLAASHEALDAEAPTIDGWYRCALEVGDPEYSPIAAVKLSERIYRLEGPSPEALDMAKMGYGPENPAARGEAALMHGHILEKLERIEEAIAAYQTAIDTGHTDWTPAGHCALGLLYASQNRVMMGRRHLWAAHDSGHPEYRPQAAYWLGMFSMWDGTHGKEGELQNAAIMFREAVDSGHPEWAPEAKSTLAALIESFGDS
ncbi:hypothetical protein GCM10009839_00010 [Catenulispora yoronensis]|uniref:Tetratricopeptide repeat protein n=1 Tax=Catenulispora yoronensis TaxID=450799 RepID=A0ABN2TJK7_9ACTN